MFKYQERIAAALVVIAEIEADVTQNWLASDGGITEAASDVLATARWAKTYMGDPRNVYSWEEFEEDRRRSETHSETTILEIVFEAIGLSPYFDGVVPRYTMAEEIELALER